MGPATASALLAAYCPTVFPFMADEAMNAVPGLKPIKYTMPHYILFARKLRSKATELNKTGSSSSDEKFSAQVVCQCLWTEAAQHMKPRVNKNAKKAKVCLTPVCVWHKSMLHPNFLPPFRAKFTACVVP